MSLYIHTAVEFQCERSMTWQCDGSSDSHFVEILLLGPHSYCLVRLEMIVLEVKAQPMDVLKPEAVPIILIS